MTTAELSGTRQTFGDVTALDGVDLTIGDSENVAVLGPSGSGESLLLRVIAGLEDVREVTALVLALTRR